jgi:uncharacterized membrane protein
MANRYAQATRRQLAVLALVALVTAAGAILRARDVVDRPVWEDEAYTWKDSQVPLARLVWWKHDPAHGPASHLLVRLSMAVFGTDAPWAMRMPSLVCGILCVPAAVWLGRVVHGDALGLMAAALVAVDPNQVDQSQQARMYTMLALVTMLALGQAVRVLRDPPAERRPWIVLGALLAAQFWINFGAAALWLGLAVTMLIVVLQLRRAADEDSLAKARRLTRGALVAYAWAGLLAARGLWRMWIFLKSDRGITSATLGETLASIGRGLEQLVGAGEYSFAILVAAVFGLVVLWRHSRPAAIALSLTAAVTLAMIVAGRSVHHMIAVRYFTVLQPAVWLGLAALMVLARASIARAAIAAGLVALVTVQAWQATHIDRWVDVNTWRYARAAARFIDASRASGDQVVCTPEVNFGWVARYHGLVSHDDGLPQRKPHTRAPDTATASSDATWVQAFMFDPRSEQILQELVNAGGAGELLPSERQRMLAAVRDKGLTVVRLSAGRFESWTYDAASDDFIPLETVVADRPTGVRTAAAPDAVR